MKRLSLIVALVTAFFAPAILSSPASAETPAISNVWASYYIDYNTGQPVTESIRADAGRPVRLEPMWPAGVWHDRRQHQEEDRFVQAGLRRGVHVRLVLLQQR
jgi:hypothetical protein